MISIVVCSIDPRKFEAVRLQYRRALAGEECEIVGVHDAKSMCEGYNRGLAVSKGEVVIFCHDDIELLAADFWPRLKGHLANYDVVGVAGTDRLVAGAWIRAGPPHIFGQVVHPHQDPNQPGRWLVSIYGAPRRAIGGMQAMDGLLLAFRRPVIEKIRWDAETFTRFHCYDMDCTFRAYLAGYRLGVACDLGLLHMSIGTFEQEWAENAAKLQLKFMGRMDRMELREFQTTAVVVNTREEALAVMTPRYWEVG